MSRLLVLVMLFLFLGFVGCQQDLTPITGKIDDLAKRIDTIEKAIQPLLTPDTTKTSITPELKMELDKIKKEITGLKTELEKNNVWHSEHLKKYHSK